MLSTFRFDPRLFRPAILALALSAGIGIPAIAQDDPTPELDPEAVAILTRATDFLAGQQAMALDWFVSFDVVIDGREKITRTRSGRNLMARGQGFYAFSETGDIRREFFFDGSVFQVFDPDRNVYSEAPFEGTFEELGASASDQLSVELPVWQVFSHLSKDELLGEAESGAYLGITRLWGREAHHLAFASYENDWQIWISTDEEAPELLMLVGTDPYTQGWPQFRTYFTNWDFSPDIPDDAFTFTPDEDTERMVWSKPARIEQ